MMVDQMLVVIPSGFDEFKEYQFTVDDLQQFTGFTIKIVMISTNECKTVRLKDMRVNRFSIMIPVEGHKNLFRDENSNAIINTDNAAYNDYMNTRRMNSDKKAELDAMKTEIETLKSMLNDLASKITS